MQQKQPIDQDFEWICCAFPGLKTFKAVYEHHDICIHIYTYMHTHIYINGVEEIINIQPIGKHAKPYQVKQVREIILKYKLGDDIHA